MDEKVVLYVNRTWGPVKLGDVKSLYYKENTPEDCIITRGTIMFRTSTNLKKSYDGHLWFGTIGTAFSYGYTYLNQDDRIKTPDRMNMWLIVAVPKNNIKLLYLMNPEFKSDPMIKRVISNPLSTINPDEKPIKSFNIFDDVFFSSFDIPNHVCRYSLYDEDPKVLKYIVSKNNMKDNDDKLHGWYQCYYHSTIPEDCFPSEIVTERDLLDMYAIPFNNVPDLTELVDIIEGYRTDQLSILLNECESYKIERSDYIELSAGKFVQSTKDVLFDKILPVKDNIFTSSSKNRSEINSLTQKLCNKFLPNFVPRRYYNPDDYNPHDYNPDYYKKNINLNSDDNNNNKFLKNPY